MAVSSDAVKELRVIDTIDFYATEKDLFFVLNLKNNTNEVLPVNKSIKPFWVYQYQESVDYKWISPSYPDGIKNRVVIKAN